MTDLKSAIAATIAKEPLSLHELLRRLHQRGRLQPLLHEAVIDQILDRQARQAGLTVADGELQQAANRYRSRLGLNSAEQTLAWLQRQRLSMADFEAVLERDLLIDKLRDHLTRERVASYFDEHRAEYDRVVLRQIVVDRDDLARELLSQLQEEGRDFAELARQHSRHPSREQGGLVGVVLRKQMPTKVAEVVFAAKPGQVVGPLAQSQGFQLILVEACQPAQLDEATSALIRQELFATWLNQQLQAAQTTFPLLDQLA